MFSSAIKSLSSNISSHYSVSQPVVFQAGPWSVFDAKRRNTGNQVSVFTFDKRKLESLLSRGGGSSSTLRRDVEETVVRLRQEASMLAKLRHPAVLELVEPVEEGRSSISFVTERVTACLTSVIERKASGRTGSDDEVDEIEIQKGLLQLAKGLEFLHFSAGIVHLGLVPGAVFVNAKGDWKISGFGFAQDFRTQGTSEYFVSPYDSRLPASMQFNMDYAAPELVLDHLLDPANDMFSLGCIVHAIYSSRPPLATNQNPSTYKNVVNQALRISRDSRFPTYLFEVLPQLLTRRPAERMSSRDFQNSKYFDNILVNTIRFLDAFPAKTTSERHAFMRGLSKVLRQFPNSVLQKKILPILVDELDKDESLVGPILTNVLEIGKDMSQLGFCTRILPSLKTMRDSPAGQIVLLDKIAIVQSKVNGTQFKDDVMPLVYQALSSQSPSVQEKALNAMPAIAKSLDFATIKNEVYPQVAGVFSHTNSLAVKVASLLALHGLIKSGLDKYTVSEKLVPLLKGMKTREPTVIMQAMQVYVPIVPMVDVSVLALDVLPHLWAMSVSPLLKVEQFKQFMELIHQAGDRVEKEHMRKLVEMDPDHGRSRNGDILPNTGDEEADFEALVLGRQPAAAATVSPARVNGGHQQQVSNRLAPKDNDDFSWNDEEEVPPKPVPKSSRSTASSFGGMRSQSGGLKLQPTRTPMNALRAQQQQQQQQQQPVFSWQQKQQQQQPQTSPVLTPKVVSPPSRPNRVPSMSESNVWANPSATPGAVRTTSFGSVGLVNGSIAGGGGGLTQASFIQALTPSTTTLTPTMASATVNAPDLNNPWTSSVSSPTAINSSSSSSFPALAPPPNRTASGSESFGFPQLVPQKPPGQQNGSSGYASLL